MQTRLTLMIAFKWTIDMTEDNQMAYPQPGWLEGVCFNLDLNNEA